MRSLKYITGVEGRRRHGCRLHQPARGHRGRATDGIGAEVAAADELVALCSRGFGRPDLLVNNAGIGIPVPRRDLRAGTPEFIERIRRINPPAPWHPIGAAESFPDEAEGSVVKVTSVAGTTVSGSSIPYAVSKAALEHLARCLTVALGPAVRVDAVAPGHIETDRTRGRTEVRDHVLKHAPAAGRGALADVADAVLGLVGSRYTTGAVLPVDGGLGPA
ncbi:SDR family oxidoreductase [Streptomyces sp. NPDC012510]|uniref:SDR family NAD(P)-dependent oxidoreductase n=1 Tax=Streptomyces sp. NPDC012510 TaxID=3364838 RepID=UPI0036EE6E34